jgi:hypothetical protein
VDKLPGLRKGLVDELVTIRVLAVELDLMEPSARRAVLAGLNALEALDERAQRRVLRYLNDLLGEGEPNGGAG